jgi:hypothetical protein
MQFSQGQGRQDTDGIEMAAMIGYDDARAIGSQIFVTYNFKPIVDPQQLANDQCCESPQSVYENVRFARESPKAIDQ